MERHRALLWRYRALLRNRAEGESGGYGGSESSYSVTNEGLFCGGRGTCTINHVRDFFLRHNALLRTRWALLSMFGGVNAHHSSS